MSELNVAFSRTAVFAVLALVVCCGKAFAQGAPPPPSVTVVPVVSREVRESADFVGRVTPIDKVDLVARVPGFVEQRLFTEGQLVKTGDLLFRIEQDTYKAAVEQQSANLAKAKATEINAALQLARGKELVRNQNIAQATIDQRAADEAAAQADVLEAQAALEQAQINLRYTEVRAPINGRIGLANFTVGNLVGPSSGTLATIVSQDPIYVIFPASEREVLDYKRRIAELGDPNGHLAVRVRLPDGSLYAQPGLTDFLDIQVDGSADTVAVRAQFAESAGAACRGGRRRCRGRSGEAESGAARSAIHRSDRPGGKLCHAGRSGKKGRAPARDDRDRPGRRCDRDERP